MPMDLLNKAVTVATLGFSNSSMLEACLRTRPVGWLAGAGSGRRVAPFLSRGPLVPFKVNQDRRHHIPRQRHKVTNWAEYDAALRQRGSLTVWFTEAAIAAWRAAPAPRPAGSRTTRRFCNGPSAVNPP